MGPGAGQGRGGGLTVLGVGCWLQEPALKVTVFDLLRCRAVGHTALKKPLTPADVKVPAVGTGKAFLWPQPAASQDHSASQCLSLRC